MTIGLAVEWVIIHSWRVCDYRTSSRVGLSSTPGEYVTIGLAVEWVIIHSWRVCDYRTSSRVGYHPLLESM